MVSVNEFPIATANEIPGFKIVETKGFVYGLTVRSRGVGGQVSAGLRSLVGGEIKEYVSMMEDSRDEALERLIEHAKQLGGNAIVQCVLILMIFPMLCRRFLLMGLLL